MKLQSMILKDPIPRFQEGSSRCRELIKHIFPSVFPTLFLHKFYIKLALSPANLRFSSKKVVIFNDSSYLTILPYIVILKLLIIYFEYFRNFLRGYVNNFKFCRIKRRCWSGLPHFLRGKC